MAEEKKKRTVGVWSEKRKSGRPPVELDETMVYKMARTCLPVEKIADILGCHKDTLYERYSDVLRKGRKERLTSLVEVGWEKALTEKDTKMIIWYQKQYLGFRESFPDEAPSSVINVNINESAT